MQPLPDEARREAAEDAQWSRWGLAAGGGGGAAVRGGSGRPGQRWLPAAPHLCSAWGALDLHASHPGPVPPPTHPEPPALSPGRPGPGGGVRSVLSREACLAGQGGSQARPPHPQDRTCDHPLSATCAGRQWAGGRWGDHAGTCSSWLSPAVVVCQRRDANRVPTGVSVVREEEPRQAALFCCRVQKALGQGSAHQHDSQGDQDREASPQSSPQAARRSELPQVLQWTPGPESGPALPGPSTSSSESPGPALLPAGPASHSWSQEGLRSQKAPLGQGLVRAGAPKPKLQHGVSLPGAQEGGRHAGCARLGSALRPPLLPRSLPAPCRGEAPLTQVAGSSAASWAEGRDL